MEERAEAVIELANAVVDTFRQLRVVGGKLHGADGPLTGERGILLEIAQHGPRTVPAMATTRATSRQLVQVTVDRLVGEGVLERRPNPAHRRSVLIALTPRGRSAVRRLRARERALAGRLPRELTTAELGHATAVLRRLGRALLVAVQEERGGLR